LESVTDLEALKGRYYSVPISSAAPSGLSFSGKLPTQGVALGWLMIAPLGLNTKERNFKKHERGRMLHKILNSAKRSPSLTLRVSFKTTSARKNIAFGDNNVNLTERQGCPGC
jgi:hypothetical protein